MNNTLGACRFSDPSRLTSNHLEVSPCQLLLQQLLTSSLILAEDWDALVPAARQKLIDCRDKMVLLPALVEYRLLTEYQASRINAGKLYGLVLGNYRVLERIGAGGMGIVFKGEHMHLRRTVAIKVLPLSADEDSRLLMRFYTEMRAIAQLQHPNIVGASDAGEVTSGGPDQPTLHYLVMEYVNGQDLEAHVVANGRFSVVQACDLAHQVACALAEANKHELVHRDIKPSNVLLTPEGQAKLLDFGLTRHFRHRLTEPGTVLGSIDYMAPEQAQDSSTVDIRADIYGLGGSLFWCLTGRTPFLPKENMAQDLACRLSQPPPSVRTLRPEVPAELDAVVMRMMAVKPEDRFAEPHAVMRALLPFLKPESRDQIILTSDSSNLWREEVSAGESANAKFHQVLVVDDEPAIRALCCCALQSDGLQCDEADCGVAALEFAQSKAYDLVLLDINMPGMEGSEVCRRLRETVAWPNLKIIMFSGRATSEEMARMLLGGADDYLSKPFSIIQLQAQVKAALRLKDAQDRSDLLNQHLLAVNHELEQNINARDSDLVHARNALVLALAKLVEYRDTETGAHLLRLQRYTQCLAEEAARQPAFAGKIDQHFIEMVTCCAPLHDIGKVGLPDHILLKPGKLDSDERIIMQAHTIIGSDTLGAIAKEHGSAMVFLQTAIDVARHHHERWDGTGYPDRLAGASIPLAARLVAIGDVYDALRSRRVYKPALSHSATLQVMRDASPGQFDPALVQAFQRCAPTFERIFRELAD